MEEVSTKTRKKLFYSLPEISEIIDEEKYIVTYWDKKFNISKKEAHSSHRCFTEDNLTAFKVVKRLIRENNLTLNGAKKVFKAEYKLEKQKQNKSSKKVAAQPVPETTIIESSDNKKNDDEIILTKEEFTDLIELLTILYQYLKMK